MSQEQNEEGQMEEYSFDENDLNYEEDKNEESINNQNQQQDNPKEELEKKKENEKNQNTNQKEEEKSNPNPFFKKKPEITEGTKDIDLYSKLSGELDNKIDNKNTVNIEPSNENSKIKKIKIIDGHNNEKENNKKIDNNEEKKSEEKQQQKSEQSYDINKYFSGKTYESKYLYVIKDDTNINNTRLKNLEGCSYLSSILRSVMSSEDLKKYFLDEMNGIKLTESLKTPNGQRLSYATHKLFKHFYLTQGEKYEPESFLRVLQEKNVLFKFNKEINPIICLNEVLNQLNDELNVKTNNYNPVEWIQTDKNDVINKGKQNYLSINNSIISQNYAWHQLEEIRCTICAGRKYSFKTFFTFDLDIANVKQEVKQNKLEICDCLDIWAKKSKKKMYCDIGCNDFSDVECTKKIINTPKIFAFLVDRKDFDKNLMEINFGLEEIINLFPYMDYSEKFVIYKLKAIVSIYEDRYINFVKIDDNNWYAFDNTNTQIVRQDDIFNTHRENSIKHIPCILFYEHIPINSQKNN